MKKGGFTYKVNQRRDMTTYSFEIRRGRELEEIVYYRENGITRLKVERYKKGKLDHVAHCNPIGSEYKWDYYKNGKVVKERWWDDYKKLIKK